VLKGAPVYAVLATNDPARSRAWYSEKLGWEPAREVAGTFEYDVPGGTFAVYETSAAGTAKNTVAIWRLSDLRGAMARLKARGVRFEDYDLGDVQTVDGVLTDPDDGTMNAWFADPDGNIWSIFDDPNEQRPESLGPMIAAADLGRAKAWYTDKLGLSPDREFEPYVLVYGSGNSSFSVYATPSAGTAKNTVAAWRVGDLAAEMTALRSKGVVFEAYDLPGLKTENGIWTAVDGSLGAWFIDSEGNILALAQDVGG
jgi:catechol 2,3-dioxygenase-like lactoylglutathione lyase family enzyme